MIAEIENLRLALVDTEADLDRSRRDVRVITDGPQFELRAVPDFDGIPGFLFCPAHP